MRYFAWPTIAGLAALVGLFYFTHSPLLVYDAVTLAFIEISMSFDNAVVNATKLEGMSPFMRRVFTTVGMLVAVGGMRFLLPLVIVKLVGNTSIGHAWQLALHDQAQFTQILASSHSIVAGFGGTFLMLTALEFFIDDEKDGHWILPFEPWLQKLGGQYQYIVRLFITWLVVVIIGFVTKDDAFRIATAAGLVCYVAVAGLKCLVEKIDDRLASAGSALVAGGIGTLIYLEVLDASFSFDGVIAAFAISNDIFVVAVGLGIGALFIRSMTIKLVEQKTLAEYVYLENGAFWSILALSIYMFAGLFVHVADYVVAATSIGFIGLAVLHSIIVNKKEAAASAVA